ncbi:MAG: NAD(P)-dependent oxidoreductase [Kordiimonadaceae bacterium]|nr:NAD(P)-dependent oxidoreductase [Kordiimonadaceae bacterium]MBO6570540.1 NAD(P)-dependent oxidoreductase [Kordiimonadaceae bacterium]MBO6966341.1 NAD(P)-dependent oxidoreductase [Kordiimonadaceae bacterium]
MPAKAKKTAAKQRVALTGATGFLGGHTLDELTAAGYTVRALTRRPQAESPGVEWVQGSLDDAQSLSLLVKGADIVMHLAGLTKAITRDQFFDVNVGGSKRLFDAAQEAKVSHVIHVSSLAAREPRLSHYGASKSGTELLLTARKWSFSWTILRPPGIYGPGDKEILKLLKATKLGILPAPGGSKNRFSLIHANDLAKALVALCDKSNKQAVLEIDDNHSGGYDIKSVAKALPGGGDKTATVVPLPFAILGAIGGVNDMLARAINKPFMLTLSTARYLSHPDWCVKEPRRFKHAGWAPQFDLESGLKDTLDWYQKNDLL